MLGDKTPAQAYGLIFGPLLLLGGLVGFLYSSAFGSPGKTDDVFGILSVNGWHNLVHVVSGGLALLCAPSPRAARRFAGWFGLAYTIVAFWGFGLGGSGTILGFLPVNVADDFLHLALGLAGIGAYLMSKERGVVAERLV